MKYKKEIFKNMDQQQVNMTFLEACEDGDIATVKYLLNTEDIKKGIKYSVGFNDNSIFMFFLRKGFDAINYVVEKMNLNIKVDINYDNGKPLQLACYYGHLEVVEYLLSSSDLQNHADIHAGNDACLREACKNKENLEVIKFLIESTKLKDHVNYQIQSIYSYDYIGISTATLANSVEILEYLLLQDYGTKDNKEKTIALNMRNAFHSKDFETIKFYLTSNITKEHVDINCDNGIGIRKAFEKNDMELIRFLLDSPLLEKKAELMPIEILFEIAMKSNKQELLEYLIFEKEIEKTLEIEKILKENKEMYDCEEITKMFLLRDLNNKLNTNLEIKTKEKVKKL